MKIDGFGGKFQQAAGDGGVAASGGVTVSSGGAKPSVPKAEQIHSFRLKLAMEESREDLKTQQAGTETKVETNRVKARSEFLAADVTSALEAYVATLEEKDKAVRFALASHPPKVDGYVIRLEVDNDFLLAKVMELHPYILSFLMKKLNNGFISLDAQVYADPDEGQDKKRIFTAKDKFEHFLALNPVVGELKSLFGLEIE